MSYSDEVRQALAGAVTQCGLRCSPYVLDQVNAPCAEIDRRAWDPRMVFAQGTGARAFVVRCLYDRTAEISAQKLMDEHMELSGASSLVAAVQDEANWPDNLVHYAAVTSIGDPVEVERGGIAYLCVEYEIEVTW